MAEEQQMAAMRRAYQQGGLSESELAPSWLAQFGRWFAEAVESRQVIEPNAMVLGTATVDGRPSGRVVLLKSYDADGFVFYTNYDSRKGQELTANPQGCLVFSWLPLERQVVVCGQVDRVSREESASYFASRPRGSQLGAWASRQSAVVPSRESLDRALAEALERFPGDSPVPAPENWGGYRVLPETVEFWQGRPNRLHDRLQFRRRPDGAWVIERLAP